MTFILGILFVISGNTFNLEQYYILSLQKPKRLILLTHKTLIINFKTKSSSHKNTDYLIAQVYDVIILEFPQQKIYTPHNIFCKYLQKVFILRNGLRNDNIQQPTPVIFSSS